MSKSKMIIKPQIFAIQLDATEPFYHNSNYTDVSRKLEETRKYLEFKEPGWSKNHKIVIVTGTIDWNGK